jgi:uncharacterized protein YozE (UPF0346 family)
MHFVEWLEQQTNRDDKVGDLARDVQIDPAFPREDCLEGIQDYMREHGSEAAFAATNVAILEWTLELENSNRIH